MQFHVAEDVLPGHPDRLADAVAEAFVDHAVNCDLDALVGVEVAVSTDKVFITGRMAFVDGRIVYPGADRSSDLELNAEAYAKAVLKDVIEIPRKAYETAGYKGIWALNLSLQIDLDICPLADAEREMRGYSDDQNIVTGYAIGTAATSYLPPAVFVARRLKECLYQVREANADLLGPDGKTLVHFTEDGGRFSWTLCNIAIQHIKGFGYEEIYRLLLEPVQAELATLEASLPGLASTWQPALLRVNGLGDFSRGGPFGDNGLSGKKLVVDHYGPGVPIGGGALCGKDPHKIDRVGALRARQIAIRLVQKTGAHEALVTLGYLPGMDTPSWVQAQVDGTDWDTKQITAAIPVPDLSIEGTFKQLELEKVCWQNVARRGYFGNGWAWET